MLADFGLFPKSGKWMRRVSGVLKLPLLGRFLILITVVNTQEKGQQEIDPPIIRLGQKSH